MNNPIDVKGHDFQVIPFGAGGKDCPGLSFAMVVNEAVLANLVNKFDWSLLAGRATGEDLDMTQCTGLVALKFISKLLQILLSASLRLASSYL